MQEHKPNRKKLSQPTYILIVSIILLCVIKWFLFIGFRINFYELLGLLFIFVFCISFYNSAGSIKLIAPIKTYLHFLWGWFFLEGMSGLSVIFNPHGTEAASFYAKALLQELFFVVFFTCLLCYLSMLDYQKRLNLIYFYLAGVVISSIYGFCQIILVIYFGIDIDSIISILLRLPSTTIESLEFIRYAYGQTYRLNGLTGDPSVHAAYTITALPLFLYFLINNQGIKYWFLFFIVFISLVLSMSGSGFSGLIASIVCLFFLRFKNINIKSIAMSITIVGALFFLYSLYQEDISRYGSIRLNPQGSISSHLSIAIDSIKIGIQNPFGVGLNNFSIAFENETGQPGFNAHNVWITYFVQYGIIGLLYRIIFSIYIINTCLKRKTPLSIVFVSSYVGLCVAGLGYQTLDMFYINIYILLFYAVVSFERYYERLAHQTNFKTVKLVNYV